MSEDGMTHRDDTRLEEHRLHGGRVRDVLAEDFAAEDVVLERTTVREALLRDVRLRGVQVQRMEIDGDVEDLVVNGVEVMPLVEAELARRFPDYPAMRPTDADGFRHAWDVVERLWAGTVERARGLEPDRLHESVDDEYTFVETLRHLVFATESWVGRVLRQDPSPWHPLSLPWDGMPDTPGVPRDRTARPDLDTVLALRQDRMALVREVVDGLTDDDLDREVVVPDGPGWPPAGRTMPVRHPLLVVLDEEWSHRRFAERDLDALTARE
ncbi:DinB family protein [Phycicoccus flavus]|uniref:DinB family protein n=1 Tax=Phycicoccus flavus TaxID=2502783 RepID=UPI000FEC015F|nr:DinB family protein [Phycicoccus flavus]NHA67204.1 DinB family protein [Phycicoccus flavus]